MTIKFKREFDEFLGKEEICNETDLSYYISRKTWEECERVCVEKMRKMKECIIFYSNEESLEDGHEQLDWTLVNNNSAIQDYGKRARRCLDEISKWEMRK